MSGNFSQEFVLGQAGTGKTYEIRKRIGENVTTIHSLLKFYDDESLEDSYASGQLTSILKGLANQTENIIIDEVSMMSDRMFGVLYRAFKYVNELQEIQDKGGLGLILCGDMCQLPPIKAKFAFESSNWKDDEIKFTKLTKIWRQSNPQFLEALNAARCGDGSLCAAILSSLNDITWLPMLDSHFEGTTIVATNKECDRLNEIRLDGLIREGNKQETYNKRQWGKSRVEWKSIPDSLVVCDNAYVMILSNDTPEFTYVNGDVGYIKQLAKDCIRIKLKRKDLEVEIRQITRKNLVKDHPMGLKKPEFMSKGEFKDKFGDNFLVGNLTVEYKRYLKQLTDDYKLLNPNAPYFSYIDNKWCIGECTYMPIRLAYATTNHKSQGLTLDKAQIDFSNGFFGMPAMAYVALSRVRSHEGLSIVGGPSKLANRTNVMYEVLRWI
jgi:ATP-dependent DNA helicase PIF1